MSVRKRPRNSTLRCGFANITQWGDKAAGFLREAQHLDIMIMAEHRQLPGEECRKLRHAAHSAGWKAVLGAGAPTDKGSCSGGLVIFAKQHLQLHSDPCQQPEVGARWVLSILRVRGLWLTIAGVYLQPGEGLHGENLRQLASLGAALRASGRPFVLTGDWNVPLADFAASPWLTEVGACICPMPTVAHTCRGSHGTSTIDFVIASAVARALVGEVEAASLSPWKPHRGLEFPLLARPRTLLVRRLVKPRPLEALGKEEAARSREQEGQWSGLEELADARQAHRFATRSPSRALAAHLEAHPLGDVSRDLGRRFRRWVLALEIGACRFRGVSPEGHVGRGQFPRLVWSPLVPFREKALRGYGPDATAWATAHARLQDAAAASPSDRPALVRQAVQAARGYFLDGGDGEDGFPDALQAFDALMKQAETSDAALQAALGAADALGKEAEQRSAARAQQSWAAWLESALQQGAGPAHRLAREASQAPVMEGVGADGQVLQGPQELVDHSSRSWAALWSRDADRQDELCALLGSLRAKAKEEPPLPPLSGQRLADAARTLRSTTGLGLDLLAPDLLKEAPLEAMDALAALLRDVEGNLMWPDSALEALCLLLPKPQGGERPILLLPMLYRLWMAARREEVAAWESRRAGAWDWATAGGGAEPAAMEAALRAEVAAHQGQALYALLLDLAKFYDSIRLAELGARGARLQYPLVLLILGLEIYRAPRTLRWGTAHALPVDIANSIAAGCAQATCMARIMLYETMEKLVGPDFPLSAGREYVDDVLLLTAGPLRDAEQEFFQGAMLLRDDFADMGCDISPKTVVVASDARRGRALVSALSRSGLPCAHRHRARDLGVDFGAGRRRSAHVARGRVRRSRVRGGRISVLARTNKTARKLHPTGGLPAGVWGAVHGMPPSSLRSLRAAAAKATGSWVSGSCCTTLLRMHFAPLADPAVAYPVRLLLGFAKTLERFPELAAAAAKCWPRVLSRLARSRRPWSVVHGPMAAVVATLDGLGWKAPAPRVWVDGQGCRYEVQGDDFGAMKKQIAEAVDACLWRRAARHLHGGGLEEGALVGHIAELRATSSDREAGWHRALAAGAIWTEQRRFEAGFRTTPLCQRCGRGPEDLHHLLWGCQSNRLIDHPAVAESEHLTAEVSLEWPAFWLRGLLPRRALVGLEAPTDAMTWEFGDFGAAVEAATGAAGARPVAWGTDGSGGAESAVAALRRVGWSASAVQQQHEGHWEPIWAVFGTLEGAEQTVPRAEAWALRELTRLFVARLPALPAASRPRTVQVAVDNRGACGSFAAAVGGLARARRAHYDIWTEVTGWLAGLPELGTSLTVYKIKSHASEDDIRRLSLTEAGVAANTAADVFADAAAERAQLPLDTRASFFAAKAKAVLVLRRAAAILAHVAELPVDASRVLKPPKRRKRGEEARDLSTSHVIAILSSGRARCSRCFAFVPRTLRQQRKWWKSDCPGAPGDAAGGPHPSHELRVLHHVVYCMVCGAWASRGFVLLAQPCFGGPRSRAGTAALRLFRSGRLPMRAGSHEEVRLCVSD